MASGSFETLIRNSFVCLTTNVRVYIWDELVLIIYKGDDFEIEAVALQFAPGDFLRTQGIKLKHETPPVGSFASYFVLPQGLVPDPVRRCVKYLTTLYRTPAHHAEAVKSLNAQLDCFVSSAHLDAAITATVAFYSRGIDLKRPPTLADVRCLYGFLAQQARSTNHVLHDVNWPILTASEAAGTSQV